MSHLMEHTNITRCDSCMRATRHPRMRALHALQYVSHSNACRPQRVACLQWYQECVLHSRLLQSHMSFAVKSSLAGGMCKVREHQVYVCFG